MNILKPLLVFVFGAFLPLFVLAQQDSIKDKNNSIELDYFSPKEYEIGNIIVTGADHLDHPSIILISSDKITDAIDKLWKQNIFDDVQILVEKIEGKTLFLNFAFKTKPRMASYKFTGKNIKPKQQVISFWTG